MDKDAHFAALERMYHAAPVNEIYQPRADVREGEAIIEMDVTEKLFHSAGAMHGSASFKMLDDAAFFAANSLEREVFVVTSSFTTYFTRPVTRAGRLRAEGRVVHEGRSQLIAEAVVNDENGNAVARGSGTFVRGKLPLTEARGYDD